MDHPPVNLLDLTLIAELDRIGREVEADDSVRVMVLDSADPEFFATDADVNLILRLPIDDESRHTELGSFHAMVDRFRTMPKATIAVIEGIARAVEVSWHSRSTCASPPSAVPCSPSQRWRWASSLGEAAHRDCTSRWPGSGTGNHLGCSDIDAETAEHWGYVNRALPDDELRTFVDRLAARSSSRPPPSATPRLRSMRHCQIPSMDSSSRTNSSGPASRTPKPRPAWQRFSRWADKLERLNVRLCPSSRSSPCSHAPSGGAAASRPCPGNQVELG